ALGVAEAGRVPQEHGRARYGEPQDDDPVEDGGVAVEEPAQRPEAARAQLGEGLRRRRHRGPRTPGGARSPRGRVEPRRYRGGARQPRCRATSPAPPWTPLPRRRPLPAGTRVTAALPGWSGAEPGWGRSLPLLPLRGARACSGVSP